MVGSGETMEWRGKRIFMVGIKGTGMTALAELLLAHGALLSGSDVEEEFYTDRILAELGVTVITGFDADKLPDTLDLVIYSAAYEPSRNPQLVAANARGVPLLSYTEALGAFSARQRSVAVAGVHGKTTTTAMIGALVGKLGLEGSVLVGSGVSSFGGHSTLVQGERFFVAETCEYRRHFLAFSPALLLITSVEADHLDYFTGYDDVREAFLSFSRKLPSGGILIYCSDDAGACEVAEQLMRERGDLTVIPYGRGAEGPFQLTDVQTEPGVTRFRLAGFEHGFSLQIPGEHNAVNAAAALAVLSLLYGGDEAESDSAAAADAAPAETGAETAALKQPRAAPQPPQQLRAGSDGERAVAALRAFQGTARRSELVGEAGDIIVMDDYGHHPTAIRKTLHALKAFHPGRRLVVDFMSHTYSRTSALLEQFGRCFDAADIVIVNKIYASARESFSGNVSGRDLADAISRHHREVHYAPELDEAAALAARLLRPGDLFLTLGAGNNWHIGRRLLSALEMSA